MTSGEVFRADSLTTGNGDGLVRENFLRSNTPSAEQSRLLLPRTKSNAIAVVEQVLSQHSKLVDEGSVDVAGSIHDMSSRNNWRNLKPLWGSRRGTQLTRVERT